MEWGQKIVTKDDNGVGLRRVTPILTLPPLFKIILIPGLTFFLILIFFKITFKIFNYIKINIIYK